VRGAAAAQAVAAQAVEAMLPRTAPLWEVGVGR